MQIFGISQGIGSEPDPNNALKERFSKLGKNTFFTAKL